VDPSGKVAIVTGGGTGLGRAMCFKLASAGATVAVNFPGVDEEEARGTATEIIANGGEALAVRADVAKADQVDAMVDEVVRSFGGVDILLSNAGTTVFVPFDDLDGLDEADWDRVFAVNVKGLFLASRAVVPHMKRRGAGVIVATTSGAAFKPIGSSIPYCASKAALEMVTKCLAKSLGPEIRVNSLVPGGMMTRWSAGFGAELRREQAEALPLKRHPNVEDVAEGAMLAIRNESLTGSSILIDSGGSLIA
jgi:3-oxoacyl-[acyl-carrier protein] reductase